MSEAMDKKVPLKRKRVVTACSECHRRKQKCNREKPCNFCIYRGVPDKCSYHDIAPSEKVKSRRDSVGLQSQNVVSKTEADIVSARDINFSEQVGYSSVDDSNMFVSLQKYLPNSSKYQTSDPRFRGASIQMMFRNKYNNIVAQIPSHVVTRELVGIFFTEANWHFGVLERYYFEKMYTSWLESMNASPTPSDIQRQSRDLLYFPALLFQVLAIALQFLPPETLSARTLQIEEASACILLSRKYSALGLEIMNMLGRHNPNVTAVEHDLLRSLWLKNSGRGIESWYSLGNAIRQAQDLGLHIQAEIRQSPGDDVRETLSKLWYDEYKRRLWMTLFSWDSFMAMLLGRPRSINVNDCTIKTPIDCDIPEDPSNTIPGTPGKNEKPSSQSVRLFCYALAHKMHEMVALGAHKRHVKDYNIVKTLHEQIEAMMDGLPPVVRPRNPDTTWDRSCPYIPKQRAQISVVASSFIMALHREHADLNAESQQAAIQAALDCLESQEQMFSYLNENQYRIYGLSCHSIDGCVFLATMMFKYPPSDRHLLQKTSRALKKAIERLTALSTKSAVAKSGAELLSVCYQKLQDTGSFESGSGHNSHDETLPRSPTDQELLANFGAVSDFLLSYNIEDRFRPEVFEEWAFSQPDQFVGNLDPLGYPTDFDMSTMLIDPALTSEDFDLGQPLQ